MLKISSFVAGVICLVIGHATLAQPLTIEQKVGQLLIWTYSGRSLTNRGKRWLERYQPGALLVFSRNISNAEQIAKFNSDLQTMARRHFRAPLFLMIDQEGGLVTRVKLPVPLPSALALGRVANPDFVEKFARASGRALMNLGFNVNLAPVMDVSSPWAKTFIGSRSFGGNPSRVTDLALAYSKGLFDAGMLPTAKHFPGHGGIIEDSHHMTPRKWATLDELMKKDWMPFRAFSQSNFPKMMMVAHLALPRVDRSGLPATFSKLLIQKYLRKTLGFKGLVVTDDLEMAGAAVSPDIGERAVRAFLAGNDMLMLAGSPPHQRRAFWALVDAVRSGRIPMKRLDESVDRILQMKRRLKIQEFHFARGRALASIRRLQDLSRQVLRRNFLLSLRSKTARIPELVPRSHVLIASADSRVYQGFKFRYPGPVEFFRLTPRNLGSTEAVIRKANPDLVVYYASGQMTAEWLTHIGRHLRKKMIVINTNPPAEVADQDSFESVLNVATYCPESGSWLAQYLLAPTVRAPTSEALVFGRMLKGL